MLRAHLTECEAQVLTRRMACPSRIDSLLGDSIAGQLSRATVEARENYAGVTGYVTPALADARAGFGRSNTSMAPTTKMPPCAE